MKKFLMSLLLLPVVLQERPAVALSNGWPVPCGSITSTIGWRKDPFGSGKMKWHNGIDIAVPLFTPVTPVGPGLIRYAGWHGDYGWLVVVDHHNGWFSMYGHNSALAARAGQEVTPETVIAYAGSTGKSTGVHVHYERRWFPEGATPAPAADHDPQRPATENRQAAQEGGQLGGDTNDPVAPLGMGGE